MLTVDFDRLAIARGSRVIDVGAGAGRHSFEAFRRGADVIAFDQDAAELAGVATMFEAMVEAGEVPEHASARTVCGDALALPFPDHDFDVVIASEILEHVPRDTDAIAELVRVLKPGGTLVVTVPRWLPERVCWLLSTEYHSNEGGHVRIYKADQLRAKITHRGLRFVHDAHAHALHVPYWWLKCAVGVSNTEHVLVRAYHRLLVWDMMSKPAATRIAESLLDPLLGKSVALYFQKPVVSLVEA
ncbi:class I SAM-dependent methyltransferase [Nocardia callitridis]|uniref:Class I SAM-dependent methyltransferase n=1 Tax=Nocardia callitridis TaxID=648753 RepID=A0ABP9KPQ1_9NOCA